MSANLASEFDGVVVALILLMACVSKVGAVLLGAKVAGRRVTREVWAIAFGLNARGATGIILASVGLANGLIDERIYVAMVVMAMATSVASGPAMNAMLQARQPQTAVDGELARRQPEWRRMRGRQPSAAVRDREGPPLRRRVMPTAPAGAL